MLGITNVSNAPSIVLKDTIAGDNLKPWVSGSYNGYSYRCAIPITGVTADTIAEVTFSQAQAESGNYSSICTTYDGGLYVYSKVNTQITIPSIIVHSIVESYYELENSPMSGSTKAITSGGVYDALNTITSGSSGSVQCRWYRIGCVVVVEVKGLAVTSGWQDHEVGSGYPAPVGTAGTGNNHNFYISDPSGTDGCLMYVRRDGKLMVNSQKSTTVYGTTTYITDV